MYYSTYININTNIVLLTMYIPATAHQFVMYLFIIVLYQPDLYNKPENKPAFSELVSFLISVVFLIKFFIKTLKTSC